MASQEALIFVTGKLASAITMQDHRLPRLALPQRHQYGLDNQLPILAATHRPANNEAGVKIDHHAKIQPQTADKANVGNVGYPLRVRFVSSKVSRQMISNVCRPRSRFLVAVLLLAGNALQGMPCRPSNCISRATRFRPQCWPSSPRSSQIRPAPRTLSLSACSTRIRSSKR